MLLIFAEAANQEIAAIDVLADNIQILLLVARHCTLLVDSSSLMRGLHSQGMVIIKYKLIYRWIFFLSFRYPRLGEVKWSIELGNEEWMGIALGGRMNG